MRLFYSGYIESAALSAAPDITSVEATDTGANVEFAVRVAGNPAAGVQQVWVTYTGHGPQAWVSADLQQDPDDSTLWKTTVPIASPANVRFMVQAVNGLGLVSLDDALGAYHTVVTASTTPPKATTLQLQSPPTTGAFGESKTVSAKLTETGSPVAGKSIVLSIGSSARIATTGADGVATVAIPVNADAGPAVVKASFGGDDQYLPSDDSAAFTVTKAVTALSAFTAQLPVVTAAATTTGVTTTLTANLGGATSAVQYQTVTFTLSGPASKTFSTITDFLGRASLPSTGLAAGTYSVTARFAGDSTYAGVTRTGGSLVVSPFVGFLPPVDNPPTVNTAKAGVIVPFIFTVGGNRGLGILAPGSPEITIVNCTTGAVIDEIEPTSGVPTITGLYFIPVLKVYAYVWKTPTNLAGKCVRFDLKLVDRSSHVALFKFR
jgi:hypothetical protein